MRREFTYTGRPAEWPSRPATGSPGKQETSSLASWMDALPGSGAAPQNVVLGQALTRPAVGVYHLWGVAALRLTPASKARLTWHRPLGRVARGAGSGQDHVGRRPAPEVEVLLSPSRDAEEIVAGPGALQTEEAAPPLLAELLVAQVANRAGRHETGRLSGAWCRRCAPLVTALGPRIRPGRDRVPVPRRGPRPGPDLPPGCSRPGRAEPGLAGGCAPVRLGPDVRLTRRRHPRTAARQRFARRRAAVPRARRSTPPPGARGPSPRLRCEPPGTKPPSAPCCRSVTSSMPTRSSPTSTTSTGSPQVWACSWRGRTMDTLPEAEPPTQHHPFP